jgi:hypothetical protein
VSSLFIANPDISIGDVSSSPEGDPEDWTSFWHPVYGTCVTFEPIVPLAELLGGSDFEFLFLNLDFDAAFPTERFFSFLTWIFN